MTHEESIELIKKWQEEKCYASRDALLLGYQGMIKKFAKRFEGMTDKFEYDDFVSVGQIAVLKAIDKFDIRHKEVTLFFIKYVEGYIKNLLNKKSNNFCYLEDETEDDESYEEFISSEDECHSKILETKDAYDKVINNGLKVLSKTERMVIKNLYGIGFKEKGVSTLAKKWGKSSQAIYLSKDSALKKLKKLILK